MVSREPGRRGGGRAAAREGMGRSAHSSGPATHQCCTIVRSGHWNLRNSSNHWNDIQFCCSKYRDRVTPGKIESRRPLTAVLTVSCNVKMITLPANWNLNEAWLSGLSEKENNCEKPKCFVSCKYWEDWEDESLNEWRLLNTDNDWEVSIRP